MQTPFDFDVSLCPDLFDDIHPGGRWKWKTGRWRCLFPHTHTRAHTRAEVHSLHCNPNSCQLEMQCFLFSDPQLKSWRCLLSLHTILPAAATVLLTSAVCACVCVQKPQSCISELNNRFLPSCSLQLLLRLEWKNRSCSVKRLFDNAGWQIFHAVGN